MQDVRCLADGSDDTAVTVRWRVTAPTERGVSEVRAYFDHDMFRVQMREMERRLNDKFAK